MFKCKEKSCLCSWVAYCDNHVSGATWQTECKKECQENCWRLPNCMWFGVTCWACVLANVTWGMFQSISWSWHALRRIHLIYQQIVYADWLERASSNRPHVFSQGRAKVMCCSSGIWQSTYDQNSVLFKISRSLPGIFHFTNQQNNRPILGGGGCPMQRIQSAYSIRGQQGCKVFKKDCWRWFNKQTSPKIDKEKTTTRWTP